MNWFLARLKEPSSWRGMILLLTVCGMRLEPDQQEAIIAAGLAIVGLLGVFTKDNPNPPLPDRLNTKAPLRYEEKLNATDHHQIPEIELQGQSVSASEVGTLPAGVSQGCTDRILPTHPVRTTHRMSVQSDDQSEPPGWNG